MKELDRAQRSRESLVGLKGLHPLTDTHGMHRQVAWFTTLALLVGVFSVGAPQEAVAAPIQAAGTVHGGLYVPWEATADLNGAAAATGKRVTFGGTFANTNESPGPTSGYSVTKDRLEKIWQGQATPFVNLEINATSPSIAAGNKDAEIHRWVDHLQLFLGAGGGRSLVLAPLQEMNGNWVPWGCNPTAFRQAYQRIHNIIRNRGIDETKVRFAFAPNGWSGCGTIAEYYPGDSYVDVIGISAYRWADGASVYQVMGGIIDQLAGAYPTKPLVISQTGVWPSGTKSQWIRDMFSWAASHPNVAAIIYFNYNKAGQANETDWRIWTGTMDPGWRDGMLRGSTAYQWPLTSWFGPGPLTLHIPPGENLCPSGRDCDTTAHQDASGRFRLFQYATSGLGLLTSTFYFGNPGDVAFSGDWDCNGSETLGLYRRSDGYVYLRNSNTQGVADVSFYFGNPGDLPVAGDFNGNGCDTVSIYRPSEQRFYIVNKLGSSDGGLGAADFSFLFGNPGDKPFVGDFNGDGVDTIGLHRESSGLVYFRNSNSTGVAHSQFVFGNPGDRLVAGDWDGDGDDSVAVYRPSNGMVYLKLSNGSGAADWQMWADTQAGMVAINP